MKNYNYFSNKKIPMKNIPRSNSINGTKSKYIIPGKFHKKINYSQKYSLNNFIPVNDTNNEIKIIGSGSFGNVYLAKNTLDNKLYAIKHMEKDKLSKLLRSLKGIYREIDIQSRIEHENIVRILYTYEDKESFNLIMEYAPNGNLFHYIRKHKGLSESQTFQLFIQVVNAVYFLHKNDLIHRDIKPENILLFNNIDNNDNDNNNKEDNFLVKLCDFGWCVKLDGEERKTFCGTTEYMSPELIEHKIYSKEIDIWSLGILLYEMIHGYSPFRPNKAKFDEKEVFENIKKHNLKFGKNLSDRCKKLIYNLLAFNKNKRYKIEDIYNSEFVKYYEKNNFFIPKINLNKKEINIKKKDTNKNKIIRSFSRVCESRSNRNILNNTKIFSNSFTGQIQKNLYDIIYTKRNSKNKNRNLKLFSIEKNNISFSKENIISFINNDNKTNKNKRNRNINKIIKINSNNNLNIQKIFFPTKNNFNLTTEFNNSKRQKSLTKKNTSKKIISKEDKENYYKKINKKEKEKKKQEQETIKLDSHRGNFIQYILKDFNIENNKKYIIRKSPEIKNLIFDTDINSENNRNNNIKEIKETKISNNTSSKKYENIEDKNIKKNNEEFKIFNINIPKNKNKNRIKYIKQQITKSNSFNLKKGKKIILTPHNELNSSFTKEKINNTTQKKLLNIKAKNNNYFPKSEKMFINRINNINYQNNNINNFYIINNTNINNIGNNCINNKEILFESYIKKLKIEDKNKNKEKKESSEETEKSTTPKKNKDNVKINPIKLLGDFHKEYNLFININNINNNKK